MLVVPPAAPRIARCTRCGRGCSVSAPVVGLDVALTRCGGCDHRHYVLGEGAEAPDLLSPLDARQGFRPSRHVSLQRPSAMDRFIVELAGNEPVSEDQRRLSPWLAIAVPVTATPLDERFFPSDVAQNAATVDLSHSGMAFVSTSATQASYWMIDFGLAGHPGSQAILKPIRGERIDQSCWKTAGPLVTAVDDPRDASGRLIHTRRFK